MANFVHEGRYISYTPGSDVTAGDVVVQGDMIGVAPEDIESGALGNLAIAGVHAFETSTGTATVETVGTLMYWDDSGDVATSTSSSHKLIGPLTVAKADADTTAEILLRQ
jgi:predicted RecA/RadA family phage recombinase